MDEPSEQEMEFVFNGLDGSVGEVIDVTAQFIGVDGFTFTIKLDDDQFKKLKDVRVGTTVKVTLI